mmetsp:Transcript_61330/g.109283  ORF Transcript_61330/g.109283 Transcript_61330/m.109283 type:complete len:222 (+) Transcript_61330:443-1108(+)
MGNAAPPRRLRTWSRWTKKTTCSSECWTRMQKHHGAVKNARHATPRRAAAVAAAAAAESQGGSPGSVGAAPAVNAGLAAAAGALEAGAAKPAAVASDVVVDNHLGGLCSHRHREKRSNLHLCPLEDLRLGLGEHLHHCQKTFLLLYLQGQHHRRLQRIHSLRLRLMTARDWWDRLSSSPGSNNQLDLRPFKTGVHMPISTSIPAGQRCSGLRLEVFRELQA